MILKGKDFMLYAESGGFMLPVACATSMTITFNQDVKEATKPSMSRWRSYYASMLSYSISCDGLYAVEAGKISASDLRDKLISGDLVRWVAMDLSNKDVFITGFILPQSLSITSPAEGQHTFNFSAVGEGGIDTLNPYEFSAIQSSGGELAVDSNNTVAIHQETGGFPPFR